jgi:hypothetical protein
MAGGIIVSNGIVVSGVGVPLNGIAWPSGQFASGVPGWQLSAFLSSANATFGFNVTPHNLQTEWVPTGDPDSFHGASGQLPDIGHSMEIFIGDFYFRGSVVHSDYTTSTGGTIVNVGLEDDRRRLRSVKIHTEDLGQQVPSGVVSVARAFRILNGLFDIDGNPSEPLVKEYDRILQFGGTYAQILAAIDLCFNEGNCSIPTTILPTVEQIEKNIGGTISAIRFQFNLDTLDEVISRVLLDTGYDWYWNMDSQQVNLVNKKKQFDISEADILDLVSQFGSASGLNDTKQLGFGQDVVPDPTRFRVLGGHMEGFINSELLSPIDGLDTSGLDGNVVFTKIWDKLSVGFYDAGGFFRTYIPTEKELQLSLAGIEQWSYYKLYQIASGTANPPGYGIPPDAGSIAAQDSSFQSRLDPMMPLAGIATGAAESGLRVISNRRDQDQNWVIAFYNRIRDHASRHYGRSYIIQGLLYNQASGLFQVVDAAWANVENQVQGFSVSSSGTISTSGVFVEDYEINRSLGPVSPFVTEDFRIKAYVVLPKDTVYGPLGDDNPASFANWTEDAPPFNPSGDGRHYVPVTLQDVGERVIDPHANADLYAFESYPKGTLLCQLPINAGPSGGIVNDGVIFNLATMLTTITKLTGSGLLDIINPAQVLNVYSSLSGVAIPVQSRLRYGQDYPSQWVLGELHYERHEDVQVDDQFVPWAFSPEGNQTSLQIMTDRAIRRVEGKIVPKSSSRYADFQQVGLPLLSFDSFAEQNIGPSGLYGEISHGVSELNISFGIDGFTTRYKIQSYYPKFGKEAPLGERVRAQLNGILNPIDFVDLELLNPIPGPPNNSALPGDIFAPPIWFDGEQSAVRVTISEVNNIFTLSSIPGTAVDERYRGIDQHQYLKPPLALSSSNIDFREGAICIDGFLNINDKAVYHTDNFQLPNGNRILRYFTQGRPFANGTIVQIERVNPINDANYDVTIVGGTGSRAIFDLPILNGTVAIGDKTTLAAQGNAKITPGNSDGTIYLNGTTGTAAAGVTPVEIVSMTNQGSPNALAVCQELGIGSDGHYSIASGATYFNVVPIPFREMAASGDRGFLTTPDSVPSGGFGQTATISFVEIITTALRRFA